jgi:hypothetical protein
MSSAVVKKMVLRPPATRMKKLLGMRSVAPVSPAMAASVNSSVALNGKPALIICTVTMLQMIQTANPQSRLGIEIHRLRLAIRLPFDSQKALSSTFHSTISAALRLATRSVEPCCAFWFISAPILCFSKFNRRYPSRL